jgi:hypothetical protein
MRTTAILIGLCLVSLTTYGQDGSRQRVRSGVTLADYYRPEYIRPRDESTRYVLLRGEATELEWELYNPGTEEFRVGIPTGGFADLLQVTAREAPTEGKRSELTALSLIRRSPTGTGPEPLPVDELRLGPQEAIYARFRLEGVSAPGMYDLRIVPRIEGALAVAANVRFEYRVPATRAERAEYLLRRMARALGDDDCMTAQDEEARLLLVHPGSSAAFHARAECSKRRGDRAGASQAYAQARDALDQGLDDLLIAHKTPREIQDLSNRFGSAATAVQRGN